MKKNIFLLLAILGFLVPYYFITRFLIDHNFDAGLLFQQMFADSGTTAFAVDLLISVLAFWALVLIESSRLGMRNAWLYMLASLMVGLSFALPLFLYFRERRLQSARSIAAQAEHQEIFDPWKTL